MGDPRAALAQLKQLVGGQHLSRWAPQWIGAPNPSPQLSDRWAGAACRKGWADWTRAFGTEQRQLLGPCLLIQK